MIVAIPTATMTSVDDLNTNQTLLAANVQRKGFFINNVSDEILYIKFGATATTSDYSVKIAANAMYEHMGPVVYVGQVDGIWAANSTGAAKITELST